MFTRNSKSDPDAFYKDATRIYRPDRGCPADRRSLHAHSAAAKCSGAASECRRIPDAGDLRKEGPGLRTGIRTLPRRNQMRKWSVH